MNYQQQFRRCFSDGDCSSVDAEDTTYDGHLYGNDGKELRQWNGEKFDINLLSSGRCMVSRAPVTPAIPVIGEVQLCP
jgi:hypothetical protein